MRQEVHRLPPRGLAKRRVRGRVDQENTTFTHYEALNVRHLSVANQSRLIEPKKFDALMETLLTEEGNFVIDTGANTFSNLLAYMVENEVFPMLAEAGKTTYVHTIVGGGDTLADTANGFYAIAQKVNGTRVQEKVLHPRDELSIGRKRRYFIEYEMPTGQSVVEEEEDILQQSLMEKAGLEKPREDKRRRAGASFDAADFLLADDE